MAKYHVGKNGPALCKAEKRTCRYAIAEHYSTMEDAIKAFDKINENKNFYSLKKNKNDSKKVHEIVKKFRDNGFTIDTSDKLNLKFYHQAQSNSMDFSTIKITDVVQDDDKTFSVIHKPPKNTLWFSSGVENNGKVITDWNSWCVAEDFHTGGEKSLYELELAPDAVILELDESNVSNLKNIDENIFYENKIDGVSGSGITTSFFDVDHEVDWFKLKEAGVDAVRVNGNSNRNFFYGWDVDSLVVLNGKMVKNMKPVVEEDDPNILRDVEIDGELFKSS